MTQAIAPPCRSFLNSFRAEEAGAVTVDCVVLTAAIVGLGIAVAAAVASGTTDLAGAQKRCLNRIGANLANDNIPYETQMKRIQNQYRRQ